MTKEPGTGNHDSGTRQVLPKPLPFRIGLIAAGFRETVSRHVPAVLPFLSFHRQYISVIADILVYQLLNQAFILHLG